MRQMGGKIDGKLPTLSRNAELLVKLAMFQKKRSLLGCKDYRNDKSGYFFKALPDKGLVGKGTQAKGDKKLKQSFTIVFFVNASGEKVEEIVVIWKSGMSRCFRELRDPSRPGSVHYFSNPKSWMPSDFMLAVLKSFNRKLLFEQRKVILFLLFKTSRSSIRKGWLSMCSKKSMKSLLQRKSLRM